MATRTAYAPDSLRYRLRSIDCLRETIRLARRFVHLPKVVLSYAEILGLDGLRVFAINALGREVSVSIPGLSEPLRIRQGTSDKYCFEQIFLDNCYDLDFPKEPRLIVDAGANVGYASILFANKYPHASILAIEPEPSNFAALAANIRPYPRIKAIRAALWHSAEAVAVDNSDESWATYVTGLESAKQCWSSELIVQGVTVHDLFEIGGRDTIDILKLDVEGAEKEIFSAPDCSWIGNTRMLIVELHDRMVPGCSSALEQAIRPYSLRRMVRGENLVLVHTEETVS
jgi:FkbM family methyltransferase